MLFDYPQTLHLHITLVCLSVGLFGARAGGVLLAHDWPARPAMRRLSVCIDTLLLLAGINLWLLLGLNPQDNHWLAWKLALLCAYIVLGYVVLKGQHTALARLGLLTAALTCVATMASLAIWHAV